MTTETQILNFATAQWGEKTLQTPELPLAANVPSHAAHGYTAPEPEPRVESTQTPVRSGVGGASSLTHSLLIEQAAKWLQRKPCAVVITDMAHGGAETADAIGWRGKQSIVIECKASLSDFRADSHKSFRRRPETGMGCLRYFCVMRGLISPDKLPPKWGLLEWDGKRMRETKKAAPHRDNAAREEISLLLSALRRIGSNAPKGYSVKCYTMESKNRATLGVLPGGGGAEQAGDDNAPQQSGPVQYSKNSSSQKS